MPFFHCRLVPPRPSFAHDMNEAERKVMTEHVGYLGRLAEEGKAVIFGPVADPNGPWGLGILEAEDQTALDAMLSDDPTIRSEMGFRYETLPMMQAVLGRRPIEATR
jgi:uncharacterized protein YciI